MFTPTYSLTPTYSSYGSTGTYSGQQPFFSFKPKTTVEDMGRWNAVNAWNQQNTVNQGLTQDRNEYAGNVGRYGGALENIYMDQINGGWGLTPEQQSNILDVNGLGVFNPTQQMADWRSDTGNLLRAVDQGALDTRGASKSLIDSLYAGVDPVAGYDQRLDFNLKNMWDRGDSILAENDAEVRERIDSLLKGLGPGGPWTSGGGMSLYGVGGAGGGYGSGWSGGAASVGNVDLSGLDLPSEFLNNYKLSDEDRRRWENLTMQGAGGRYRAAMDDTRRGMAAAGMANPYAEAAMRDRFEMREGQALDDARLSALVSAKAEQDRRLMDIENRRSANEQTRAGVMSDIARTNAQLQDSALGRSFSAAENSAARALQAQLAAAQEAAAMERFYKQLALEGNQFATTATAGLGDRGIDWTKYGTNTTLGALADREKDLSNRMTNAATIGYGRNLDNEQRIMDARTGAARDIASGTQSVYNNINSAGLDYSNARSDRYGRIYDYDNKLKLGGVGGLQGLYDMNQAQRTSTWGDQIANNANQGQVAGSSVGGVGNYKNTKPRGFLGNLADSLGKTFGSGLGSAIAGRIP